MNPNNLLNTDPRPVSYRVARLGIAALIVVVIFSFSPYKSLHLPEHQNRGAAFIIDPSPTNSDNNFAASFPGGKEDLELLVNDAVELSGVISKEEDSTKKCLLQITINEEGVVTNAEALGTAQDSVSKIALEAIEGGPQWRPASINGTPVESTIEQIVDISFKPSEDHSRSLDN